MDGFKVFRWTALSVVLVLVVLSAAGVISYWRGLGYGVFLEMALAATVLAAAVRKSRPARVGHAFGTIDHALPALALVLPGPVARAVALEWSIVTAVPLWVRRRLGGRPESGAITYNRQFRGMITIAVVIFVLEGCALFVAVGNPIFRFVHTALSGYGILWVLGAGAGAGLYSHVIGEETVTVRFSVFRTIRLPLLPGCTVASSESPHHKKTLELSEHAGALSVLGRTNVVLRYPDPVTVAVGKTGDHEIRSFAFYADDPHATCQMITTQVAAGH